ncbi:MAG: hypothetical protein ABIJ56_09500 [Pseudomonadota bacterium]
MDHIVRDTRRLRLGEILVNAGLLEPGKLDEALKIQKESGQKLGFILITNRFVSEAQLVQALSKQMSVPWVSLTHLDISTELISTVPHELVTQFGVVPVYIMSKRHGEKVLYVAMDDPTNDDVLARIHATSSLEVKAMIAAPSEIARAISTFYSATWETGEKLLAGMATPETPGKSVEPEPGAPPAGEADAAGDEERPAEGGQQDAVVLLETSAIVEEGEEQQEAGEETPETGEGREDQGAGRAGATKAGQTLGPGWGGEREAETRQPGGAKPVSFTFLNGVTISLAQKGAHVGKEIRSEVAMLERIETILMSEQLGPASKAAVVGIIEVLFRRGLITMEEIKQLMEKMEKHA